VDVPFLHTPELGEGLRFGQYWHSTCAPHGRSDFNRWIKSRREALIAKTANLARHRRRPRAGKRDNSSHVPHGQPRKSRHETWPREVCAARKR
jgi:hypothetical protein